ncbi:MULTISPECIES: flagellar hook protein FlgE [Agrobacterium tumefaciens complex]|jgi:flagellar hook protein FlgE|uniref:Flagellar hook protein FlgE n=1 Tax=Agrobacterium genomosp. 13 str. CFBP 6927 TaxID=1183428 RepID=A0ABM9VG68_9HYPH|nr:MULTISPECIES: flagellar hook protein FlgE [Agrobacterium tumefaciens complex]TQN60283.1 flagellar hook protein FlgE [Agrobacterium tumefaciens]UXS30762.1 flagellar hook protein FlgE [Agrobacterium tumefaciens]CDN96027.1 Flagellar hook protein FlgE [Agrobacterium tumefaciens]CUX32816.1 Flagellar hook protein flgE [Agrobacterium genomosp. 13 str. CFBP 6927]
MSIFGTMRTGVSGMNAQANKLGTVGDNIANASTTGYKRASTSFSSLVLPSSSGSYASGGVQSNVRYSISEQGNLSYTTSSTDLAVQGNGFFVVQDGAGTPYLTRAGSFQKNSEGYLENAAGFLLMGYPYGTNPPAAVVNGFTGLEAININDFGLTASPSTQGSFPANLNRDEAIVAAGSRPSDNVATSKVGAKTSLTAFDSGGAKVLYDFYYTRIDNDASGNPQWEVSVYRQDQSTDGGFPYTATAPATLVKETVTLAFDPATNKLTTASPKAITINDDNSGVAQAIEIDLSQMTQFSSKFTPGTAVLNGNGPSQIKDVEIGKDGLVTAVYQDGGRRNIYQLALATVPSVDNLSPQNGNVYLPSNESGVVTIGFAQTGSFGYIQKGALEGSNVDIASELTDMIESQRIYTANSKVFQTGSDLMDVLINLKR